MPATKETYVDPTAAVDLASRPEDVDLSGAPPLSLQAMLQSIMMTQAAQGQLLDELLTEIASLQADFSNYRSFFPPPPPFE
nr:hypothetical protein CFP56_67174 [Quercus suber]